MHKIYKIILSAFITLPICTVITSCNDDDTIYPEIGSMPKSKILIYGGWELSPDYGEIYLFPNGKCYNNTECGTWSFDEKSLQVTMTVASIPYFNIINWVNTEEFNGYSEYFGYHSIIGKRCSNEKYVEAMLKLITFNTRDELSLTFINNVSFPQNKIIGRCRVNRKYLASFQFTNPFADTFEFVLTYDNGYTGLSVVRYTGSWK